VRSILQFKRKLKKATNASKIIINKREARDNAKKTKRQKLKQEE